MSTLRPLSHKTIALLALASMICIARDANAAIDSSALLDNVLSRYSTAATSWAATITAAASWLFWTLALISMVWTFGMMALRKADLGEFFAELVRFTIFTGFFWWLLVNGPDFAVSIYASLRKLAGNATGLGEAMSPSGIVDIGFALFNRTIDKSSAWSPVDSVGGMAMSLAILIVLALVAVNMLLLLVSGWVLAYAGVFFLGFGGSRWTSDMAINYYKTVLGVAAQLFVMVLIVGIGKTFLDDYYARMDTGNVHFNEMAVLLVVAVILLALVHKVPPLIAGIITGSSVGGGGIGQFGAGAAMGSASGAAAAAGVAGSFAMSAAANLGGGTSALKAAFKKAESSLSEGAGAMGLLEGLSGAQGPSGATGAQESPFSQATGHDYDAPDGPPPHGDSMPSNGHATRDASMESTSQRDPVSPSLGGSISSPEDQAEIDAFVNRDQGGDV